MCVPNVCHFLPLQHNYSITVSFNITSLYLEQLRGLDVKVDDEKVTSKLY